MSNKKDKIYLSGAIQFADDPNTWRLDFIKKLSKQYDFFNPMDVILPKEVYNASETLEKYEWIYENIVVKDLCGLDGCTYLFAKLDPSCFKGSGTVSEITIAPLLNIPIMYVLDGIEFQDIPIWTRACLSQGDDLKSIPNAIKCLKSLVK